MLEEKRLTLQLALDSQKTQAERNRLGQFATPTLLAQAILASAVQLLPPDIDIRFLDPAIGTGAFYSALCSAILLQNVIVAEGFEIDPHYGFPASGLWQDSLLKIHINDFTKIRPPTHATEKFNLLICNPPYVRHHHLIAEEKLRLQQVIKEMHGIHISGLAGLYCYFLLLAHAWLAENAIACWLIPSEFMDVNYGQALKHYLLQHVTLLRIHRFDPTDVQFDDALVSSAVIWFRKAKPAPDHEVEFTFGGTLAAPQITKALSSGLLLHSGKWTKYPAADASEIQQGARLADLFTIKRGIATGNNQFFILNKQQIHAKNLPFKFFRPILPSPRYLIQNEISADIEGNPQIACPLFLLNCRLSEQEIQDEYPALWNYLESGIPQVSDRYLCSHRTPWYAQEERLPAPLLCTYIGRTDNQSRRPFRFILNHSQATAPNVYLLLYPKPPLLAAFRENPHVLPKIWCLFNEMNIEIFLQNGRVYGGGLYKLEPNELANIPAEPFLALLPEQKNQIFHQLRLFNS